MSRRKKKGGFSRSKLTGILLTAMFVVTGLSQANVQLFSRAGILENAGEARLFETKRVDVAKRGSILTSDGKVLARTENQYEFGVEFNRVPKSRGFFVELAKAANITPAELEVGAANGRSTYYPTLLSEEQAVAVRKVRKDWKADGVSLKPVTHRIYPFGEMASNLVGIMQVPKDPQGKPLRDERNQTLPPVGSGGLEGGQEKLLVGKDGERIGFVDQEGAFLPMRTKQSRDKINGAVIETTLVSSLQESAAIEIRKAVIANNAISGTAIIMTPDGDMLACASWPSFDPVTTPEAKDFNPAYLATYEPGSTFKIVTLAEALESGAVPIGEEISDPGIFTYKGNTIHNSHGGNGMVSQEAAIAKSSNVAAASWALRIGRDKMRGLIDELNLTQPTEIGVMKEAVGGYGKKETSPMQIMNMGFGQAMTASPVALAATFSIFANNGILPSPRLIKSIDGKVVPIKKGKRMFSPEVSEYVLRLMESVIASEHGTGKALRIPGYRLAGKTGTAQKIGVKGGGYVANFVGYIPADKPKAMVLVMIDHPRGGSYYGGSVAGPVFQEIARDLLQYYRIEPHGVDEEPKKGPSLMEIAEAQYDVVNAIVDGFIAGPQAPPSKLKPNEVK